MSDSQPRRETGWAIAAVGVAISAAVWLRPEALTAPSWVGHLAAAAFVLGGAVVALRASGRTRAADLAVCGVLAVFACVGAWAALDANGSQCTAGFAAIPFRSPETACRVAFGTGSLIVTAMLVFAIRSLVRNRAAS